MRKLVSILLLTMLLSGCSFLPRLPFIKTISTVPNATTKSTTYYVCKGEFTQNPVTGVITCTKGYKSNTLAFNQSERLMTWKEKIINIINNLAGWAIPLIILALIFVPGFAGWLFHKFTSLSSKVAMSLVKGINDGKKYVRENGVDLTPEQRVVYLKGADDMLLKISAAVTDPKVAEQINILRAKANQ